jgi:exodeoxyribonuclease V gamma subunit
MQVCDEGVSEKQSQLIRLKHVSSTIGLYFNTKSKKIEKFKVCDIENVQEKLSQIITTYLQGLTKPLLLDGVIANEVFATKYGKPIELTQQRFETIWTGTYNEGGLKENLYLNYFWPECPLIDEYKEDIKSLYTPIFSHVVKG